MMNLKPMLAISMDKAKILDWRDWAIEQKFDGVRLLVEVTSSGVTAWTRPRRHAGAEGKTMAVRPLPPHLTEALSRFPAGVYDGELLGGKTSTDVVRTELQHTLVFVMFDVLRVGATLTTCEPYDDRRERLFQTFRALGLHETSPRHGEGPVRLAQSVNLKDAKDVETFVAYIWDQGGEGAMLKRRAARYAEGKRSPDLVKVKKLHTAVCTVVGFEATRGTKLNRGAFATVVLETPAGRNTSVKTKDDAELAAFQRDWDAYLKTTDVWRTMGLAELTAHANTHHPAIGRKLRIEYQEIAADGGYRHPRWDRWENE